MAENWAEDVQKVCSKRRCQSNCRDSPLLRDCFTEKGLSLVSFSDDKEVARVRNNFLKKKLALTDADADLDKAIDGVREKMKGDRTKNRVTVYYLLADHFGKLSAFG